MYQCNFLKLAKETELKLNTNWIYSF